MPSPTARITTVGLLAAVICGCVDTESSALTYAEADSAGVRVVTSAGPAWDEGEGWIVDSLPSVSIGQVEGDDPYLLDDVKGALRLPDGRILLLRMAPCWSPRSSDRRALDWTSKGGTSAVHGWTTTG